MLNIFCHRDRVIFAFPSRGRDLQLLPDQAERLAEEVEDASRYCEAWITSGGTPELIHGGTRGVHVESWDGFVNVRFDSVIDRESIPYQAARLIAGELRAKVVEARERVRIRWFTQEAK